MRLLPFLVRGQTVVVGHELLVRFSFELCFFYLSSQLLVRAQDFLRELGAQQSLLLLQYLLLEKRQSVLLGLLECLVRFLHVD